MKWTIGRKLIVSFLAVSAITLVVGIVGYRTATAAGRNLHDVAAVRMRGMHALLTIKQGGTDLKSVQRTLLTQDLAADVQARQAQFIVKSREGYDAARQAYDPLPKTAEEASLWAQFTAAWEQYGQVNDAFLAMVQETRALDLGNPYALRESIECFRGDHYKLMMQVQRMLETGVPFDGGEDAAACNFGKWLASYTTTNADMLADLQAVRDPHGRFHDAIRRCKAAVVAGDLEGARGVYESEVLGSSEQTFAIFDRLNGRARQAQELAARTQHQAMIVCRDKQLTANDLLDKLIAISQREVDGTVARATAEAAFAKTASLIAMAGGVVLAVGLGVLISRGIVRTMRGTIDMIKDIATGDGDLTKRLDTRSSDECGELAKWFNQFVGQLHGMLVNIADTADDVAAAATEISASNEQISTGAQQQTSQTTEVATAVEEMSATVMEVAKNAATAAEASRESLNVAEQGGRVVEQTVEGIQAISRSTGQASATIEELGKASEQIGQIIGVINDIADQTNLLALNAAIEAARAGEHGRGFAVVADEVRKLAERTGEATKEVGTTIRAIQEKTGSAVAAMDDGGKQVERGVESAGQAGEALQSIVNSANSISQLIQQIAAAAEQQSSASEQISRNIESITSVTTQNAAAVQQAAAASHQLARRAEELQGMVGRFKLDRSAAAATAA